MEQAYWTVGVTVGLIIVICIWRIRTIHKDTEDKIRSNHAVHWAWIRAKRAQIKKEKANHEEG